MSAIFIVLIAMAIFAAGAIMGFVMAGILCAGRQADDDIERLLIDAENRRRIHRI